MKVIFLDVDGVLNHSGCPEWVNDDYRVLDSKCVYRMKRVCECTGARIVVSSTWRLSSEGMAPLLAAFGDLIIGVTPARNVGARRAEIQEWLMQHVAIPITMCIVDDDLDAEIPLLPFVQTGFETGGFTDAHAARVEAALSPPSLLKRQVNALR